MSDDERIWEHGWDGHEMAQLRRLARLTLAEKLDWLEQAQEMADRLERAKRTPPEGEKPDQA